MKAKHSSGIYVFDRGMIEGAETFCKNSFEEGFLSHQDYHDYVSDLKRGMDKLGRNAQHSWLESLIVYLRVEDPRVLQERQVRRGTKGEVIPFDYLQRINEKYGELMNNLPDVYARYGVKAPKLITVDASIDFKRDPFYHSRILEQIVAEIGARSTPRE
jgi:deoxyadenosine/deoxycytidine kinase